MSMTAITIVNGQYFSSQIYIMIEDKGTCNCQVSLMSDYLYNYSDFMKTCHIFL